MKTEKRILSLILALVVTLCLSTSAFGAETTTDEAAHTVYFNETFDSLALGSKKITNFVLTAGENTGAVVNLEDGKAFKMQAINYNGLYLDTTNLTDGTTGNLVLDLSIYMPAIDARPKTIEVTSTNGITNTLCTIANSSILLSDGSRAAGFVENKTYKLAIALNFEKQTMDLYFNGKARVKNHSFKKTGMDNLNRVRLSMRNSDEPGSMIIDNLRLYQADVPMEDISGGGNNDSTDNNEETNEVISTGQGISTQPDAMNISDADVAVVAEKSLIMAIKSHNALVNNVQKVISKDKSVTPVYKENNVLVPARFFAENIGASLSYDKNSNSITITKGDKVVSMTFNDKKLTHNGQVMELPVAACNIGGVGYVPVCELCDALDMYLFLDGELLICNENEMELSWFNNKGLLRGICERFIADEVEGSEIVALVKQKWPNNQHPRMIMTEEKFAKIRAELAKGNECDPVYAALYKALKIKCDDTMETEPLGYEFRDGVRLMQVCDSMQARFLPLALMYNITGNEAYAVRARQEIIAACLFKDWHPYHFLDTGIMASGIALAYDWLYNWLDEADRQLIRNAIVKHAIKQVVNDYDMTVKKGTDDGNLLNRSTFWATDNGGNWRFVAGGGVATAALAICDELTGNDLAMAERSLKEGLKGIRVSLCEFSPDGSNEEGTGYWDLSSHYFHRHILSLISSVGDDFGYLDYPGLDKTNGWLMSTSGPAAGYAFHDAARAQTSITPSTMSWALDYGKYGEAKTRINQILAGSGNYRDMMFYDPILLSENNGDDSLDIISDATGVFSSRSEWSSYATWLGFHADVGIAKSTHKHSDGGSFALQAMGEEWFFDLGSDSYTIPNYRSDAYRCRAEGHNGILLNPGQGQYGAYDMQYEGFCKIDKYEFKPKGSYAISNITDLWREDLESGWRGVKLDNFRRTVTVQDELVMKKPSEFYWFAHTEADIEISDDGKTAYLTKNGKTLLCEIVHGDGAKFSVMEAKPLPTSPKCEGQDENDGIRKLTIHMENVSSLNLTVVFNALDQSYQEGSYSKEFVPMQQWTIPDGENDFGYARLKSISVNGEKLQGFIDNEYDYRVVLPAGTTTIPTVSATADCEFTIEQAVPGIGAKAVIKTVPYGNKVSQTYEVRFENEGIAGLPTGVSEVKPTNVKATQVPQAENIPVNTTDNNLETKWAASGIGSIEYDLGSVRNLHSVAVALGSATTRTNFFAIEISEDGVNYTKVMDGAGIWTENYEHHLLSGAKARFVRFTGKGNSSSDWTSLMEVKIFLQN